MNITEFLEARIAEDEATAREASKGPWEWIGDSADDSEFLYAADNEPVIDAYGLHTTGFIVCSDPDRAYISRNNPTRVLAECKAKRAVLEQAEEADSETEYVIQESFINQTESDEARATAPGKLIREALAAVYADHPDYRQEWA